MVNKYIVLGAGMQGTAAASYLAEHGEANEILIVDKNFDKAKAAHARLTNLMPNFLFTVSSNLPKDISGYHGLFSSATFKINLKLTKQCIKAGVHMVDLGGNTEVVKKQVKSNMDAIKNKVSIVPDCGLAPGLGNAIAADFIDKYEQLNNIKILCGGLPIQPVGPLGYKVVFSPEGLINEYFEPSYLIKGGLTQTVAGFTGLEDVVVDDIPLEAFVTSGGSSLAPFIYEGKVNNYEYKTLRFRGHHEKFKMLKDLNLLDAFKKSATGALAFPEVEDMVLLDVTASDNLGHSINAMLKVVGNEPTTGFSAMEVTTAYSAAQVLIDSVNDLTASGVNTLDRAYTEGEIGNYLTRLQDNASFDIVITEGGLSNEKNSSGLFKHQISRLFGQK